MAKYIKRYIKVYRYNANTEIGNIEYISNQIAKISSCRKYPLFDMNKILIF